MTSSGSRHRGREAALCMLYQQELSGDSIERVIAAYFEGRLAEPPLAAASRSFAERLARGVSLRKEEVDRLIRAGSIHWRLERMAVVDRNVLRLALFELLDEPDTPAAVILDEAVELAKLFGGPESGAFVNGVVDGIRKQLDDGTLVRSPS
ncbi:MAG: transcription antitermination factor NusB [Acidobacteriota bacterium]|nr:transcription antitermination factor NusB [Acidobacteriota bacterium]